MDHKAKAIVLLGMLGAGLADQPHAQELTPEIFVRTDTEARQLMLTEMEARLALLQVGADLEAQAQLSDDFRTQVEAVFASYGTSGPGQATYGSANADAIAAWLTANPAWQQQYQDLDARFEVLSQQLDALLGGAQQ